MNKKLMAVAVAGALAVPAVAFAQASNVQIYGRVNVGVDNYGATGASTANASGIVSRMRIFDSSSRLGVRGTEDLGNGLKAIFLMESGVNVDNGGATGQSGGANASSGTLSSRIGHVGLDGRFGTVTFGRTNVFWGNGTMDQTQANYTNAGTPHQTGGFGSGMGVGVTRVSNVVQYTTPTMSGFNAQVSWSPNNQEAVQQTTSSLPAVGGSTAADAKGRLWGVTLNWAGGPFALGFDWVSNRSNGTNFTAVPGTAAGNLAGGNGNNGENIGTKLRGGWSYQPGANVALIWVRSEVKNGGSSAAGLSNGASAALADGTNATLKQTGWLLNWEHMFGNIQGLAQYGRANKVTGCQNVGLGGVVGQSNCSNTGATAYMLGARYLMSKRTAAYLTYNAVKNDSNYFMDYNGGALTSTAAANQAIPAGAAGSSAGADPRMWALGIIHNF